MANLRHRVTIDSIVCAGSLSNGNNNDEVFIEYQADAGIPVRYPLDAKYQRMNTPGNTHDGAISTWSPALVLDFDHEVLVTLWDQDSVTGWNAADFLLNVEYRADLFTPTAHMVTDQGSDYTVNATQNY